MRGRSSRRSRGAQTLFVDSSTTGYYVAQAIIEAGVAATVLTSSLPVMNLIGNADAPNVDLIALGGTFRKLTHSFVGPDTVRALRGYLVDRVVFSVKGVTPEGLLTDADPLEAEVKRAMIAHAQTAVLLATAQKFEDRGLAVVCPLSESTSPTSRTRRRMRFACSRRTTSRLIAPRLSRPAERPPRFPGGPAA